MHLEDAINRTWTGALIEHSLRGHYNRTWTEDTIIEHTHRGRY